MSERTALVTGGSRGIGRAVAVALAAQGCRVAVNYRERADDAKKTLVAVEEAGGSGICVRCNVGRSEDVTRLFDEVEAALGAVTVLVNNAGVRRDSLAVRTSDDAWDEVLTTNLYGTFFCSRRALRSMLPARYGRIVNVSSVAALRGSPGQVGYSAAKAGMIGLTRTLAAEVASRGITVNAVAPGPVATDLTAGLDAGGWDRLVSQIPQGRAGRPEDVASAVAWLCSDDAAFVTGTVLVTDGGMTA